MILIMSGLFMSMLTGKTPTDMRGRILFPFICFDPEKVNFTGARIGINFYMRL